MIQLKEYNRCTSLGLQSNSSSLKPFIRLILFFFFFTNCTANSKQLIEKNKKQIIFSNETVDYYRDEIKRAVSLLTSKTQTINLELNKKERAEIIAIAFPEVLRYNSFSDYIETSTNRVLYIKKGKKASDFSTGYFQMKPSFIEDLENYVAKNESLQQYHCILIKKKSEIEIKKERINRLESFQWQLRYLKIFWNIAELKYKHIEFKTKNDKIRFYATAYNYGFTKPEKEIIKYQNIRIFPY